MIYWDTSALFAFVFAEEQSAALRVLIENQKSSATYTSIITPLEFESAIQRRLADRTLSAKEADAARLFSVDFRKKSSLLPLDQNSLDTALHLQKIYKLRPGDSIQLSAARLGTDNPARVIFLCLDEKLNEAALREGFQVFAD